MLGGPVTFGGQYALGAGPVGSTLLDFADHVSLYIDGASVTVEEGTAELETALHERAMFRCTLVNPATPPQDGQRVVLMSFEERLFAGHIWSVSQRVMENRKASYFDVKCVDLAQALERSVKKHTYTNQSSRMIVEELLRSDLNAEGIWAGRLDEGARFPLVDVDYVRCAELLRDVADGAGLLTWVDPFGRLHAVQQLVDVAPFAVQAGTAGQITIDKTKETYKNVALVTCRSQDGSDSVLVERTNPTEIAARQAREGGTGRYEIYARIQHPTSNDTVELQRLATTYAVIQLARSNAVRHTLSCRTFTYGLKVGQSLTVSLPEYQASGTWTITKVRLKQLTLHTFQFHVEAVQASLFERLYDAYLQIVGAGRAIVQLPIGLFNNVVEFLANGSWVVPGSGTVEIELDGFAAGGGGGGYDGVGPSGAGGNGGNGGPGGKAVTFLSVPAGTQIDLVVPAAGPSGLGAGATTVTFTTPTTTTWVVPGTGNVRVEVTVNGAGGGGSGASQLLTTEQPGNPGGRGGQGKSWRIYAAGTTLDLVVGAGGAGAAGGVFPNSPGAAGAASSVKLSGVTVAQGNGGQGGTGAGGFGGTAGAAGGGTGDSVTTGGGPTGGAGGAISFGTGGTGSNGSIVIRYADADDGGGGGTVTASIGGVVKMQANGGGAGLSGLNGGAAGVPGSGLGDQVFVGEGSDGGAGGFVSTVNGQPGTAGKVQIRY